MLDKLKMQMQFLVEIDKIKNIIRKSKIFSNNRYENDAEHSWHICMMAIILAEYSNEKINLLKVLKMLLIHDIVEIYTGDTIVYNKTADHLEAEKKSAERVFGLLPGEQKKEYIELWNEFEKRESSEAKFAAALDRIEPALQNIFHNCETWNEHSISCSQVIEVNKKINDGASLLWDYLKDKIDHCYRDGLFG